MVWISVIGPTDQYTRLVKVSNQITINHCCDGLTRMALRLLVWSKELYDPNVDIVVYLGFPVHIGLVIWFFDL